MSEVKAAETAAGRPVPAPAAGGPQSPAEALDGVGHRDAADAAGVGKGSILAS